MDNSREKEGIAKRVTASSHSKQDLEKLYALQLIARYVVLHFPK